MKEFEQQDVIVCTADVLLHCLHHSFLRTEHINFLIFDEAHHAKRNHPYARIMGFYAAQKNEGLNPRIFGMTASPVDVDKRDEVSLNATELEWMLDSHIATVDPSKIKDFVNRPEEDRLFFEPLKDATESQLYKAIESHCVDVEHFRRLFRSAKLIRNELGRWCSNEYWSFAFSDEIAKKQEMKAEQSYSQERVKKSQEDLTNEIKQLQEARSVIDGDQTGTPNLSSPKDVETDVDEHAITDKVRQLHAYLNRHFERPTDTRCLVFVERRHTARLLNRVFEHLGNANLRPGELFGSNSQSQDGAYLSFKEQAKTLLDFRKGHINCLFATSIAEEGLDVPECNLVVRFDPCKTMIQYIQSRGRARQKNSRFVHMLEWHNPLQQHDLSEIRRAEVAMRHFCKTLPTDRLLVGNHDLDDEFDQDESPRTFEHPKSRALLTYSFSLGVLQNYVDNLPHDEGDDMSLSYNIYRRHNSFVCEITLPARSEGIYSVLSRPYPRKSTAKMSAAYDLCMELLNKRRIDEFFMPTKRKRDHLMRNARLAKGLEKSAAYAILKKPDKWAAERGTVPTRLFMTVITLDGSWERPTQPIGLLTRSAMPDFPEFPIFKVDGDHCMVKTLSLRKALGVAPQLLSHMTGFTLRIYKDLFNKTFEVNDAKMTYWVVPLETIPADITVNHNYPKDLIDLTATSYGATEGPLKWDPTFKPEDLVNKFLVDPLSGGRRLFSDKLRPDMKPTDPVPSDTARGPRKATNIIEYSSSLFSSSKNRRVWEADQPVLEVEKVLHRLNVTAIPSEEDREALTVCFVCPEPLNISPLSAPIASMAYLFPAIIHRVESYLIALEFCDQLGVSVPPKLALEAITKDADNTDEHKAEQVNAQRGMGGNYERLEFIGDTFLKMATTMATYIREAKRDEYYLHVERMMSLCNKNLYENAERQGFPKYIRGLQFSRRSWYPDGLTLIEGKSVNQGESEKDVVKQRFAQKTIADVCEAMIGAALVTYVQNGLEELYKFDDAVKAVTQLVSTEEHNNHDMRCWADYYKAYKLPAYQIAECTGSDHNIAAQVARVENYTFKYPKLLTCAFMHPSVPRVYAGGVPSYQRQEYLGDSLLDMAAVLYLFHSYPDQDPQWLTEHKMAIVSNKFQGALAVKLGFHKLLKYRSAIEGQITKYVQEVEEARTANKDSREYWNHVSSPPKCLADTLEAYVGALFIDCEFNFAEIQRFFDDHIRYFFEDMSIYDTFATNHPINRIQVLIGDAYGCSNFKVMTKEIIADDEYSCTYYGAVMVHTSVAAFAHKESQSGAKIAAAVNGLKNLEGLAPYEFRERFSCVCTTAKHAAKKANKDVEQPGNGEMRSVNGHAANGEECGNAEILKGVEGLKVNVKPVEELDQGAGVGAQRDPDREFKDGLERE